MAEESDLEKTEPASERRIEQAREEGQVARSPELATFVVVAAGVAALWGLAAHVGHALQSLIRDALGFEPGLAFDAGALPGVLQGQAGRALLAFLPFGGLMLVAALAAPLLLHGWLFSPQAMAPDFTRLNPVSGLQRMLSWNSLAELGKSLLKAALLTAVAWWVGMALVGDILQLARLPLGAALERSGGILGLTALALLGAMLLVAAIDVPYQLWSYGRKLRMTRDELRREMKETEGDPQLKARVRSLQREAARRRMMAQVPKADVVVTNPTRYAVALRYREGAMRAPQVVAKGALRIAERIRELAAEHGVPVVEAPPLARALYRHAPIDREIPQALYAAVAELLAYVYQLRVSLSKGGKAPPPPAAIDVPPGLDPEAAAT